MKKSNNPTISPVIAFMFQWNEQVAWDARMYWFIPRLLPHRATCCLWNYLHISPVETRPISVDTHCNAHEHGRTHKRTHDAYTFDAINSIKMVRATVAHMRLEWTSETVFVLTHRLRREESSIEILVCWLRFVGKVMGISVCTGTTAATSLAPFEQKVHIMPDQIWEIFLWTQN